MSGVENPETPVAANVQVAPPENETGVPAAQTAPAGDPTRPAAPEYIANSNEKGKNTTPYENPGLQPCTKCDVGVLYVIAWDDKALHEVGQPIYAPNMLSGGVVKVACFNCGHGETFPMNPAEAPVNPNSGA